MNNAAQAVQDSKQATGGGTHKAKEVVFRSHSRELTVTFPPEQFGMGTGMNLLRDRQGAPVLDEDNKPVREPQPYQDALFAREGAFGVFRTSDPAEIERLRNHTGNQQNRGSDFWEDQGHLSELLEGESRIIIGSPAGGVTADDQALLSKLDSFATRIPPKAEAAAYNAFQSALVRFDVEGLTVPAQDKGTRLLKARITEFLAIVQDAGIWGPGIGTAGAPDAPGSAQET